jgi:uncharacterized damage-inducible protein DinB
MILDMIHQLYRYNRWANSRLLEAANTLTLQELKRELGGSFPSLHKTLLHLLWVEMMFLRRWRGLSTADLAEPPELKTVEKIRSVWEEVWKEQNRFLEKLGDADLNHVLSYIDTRGRSIALPLKDTLLQTVNHSTYHRGQLASQLRQLGRVPPATDFILFCRETQ